MPGVDRPVHFARSAPFAVNSGQLIFYDVVDSRGMSRSSLLSRIAKSDGEAKLPDSVSVFDFRKWLAAVEDSESEFKRRSFTFMCTAIKVAHAVDDQHVDRWIQTAADNLVQSALSSSSEEVKEGAAEGLSLLSEHQQHRVFAAAAFNSQNLDSMLTFLPTRLHASVLAGNITPEKTLRMPVKDTSIPALQALASLPASPPPMLSFHVVSDSSESRSHWSFRHRKERPDTLPPLAEALQHHTALTSLLLRAPSTTDTVSQLKPLLPAIASLTSLVCLHLENLCAIPVASVPALERALLAMPELRELKLRLVEEPLYSGMKRQREAAPPQCCLADMLSPATALTSLSLRSSRSGCGPYPGCFTATVPLILPQLDQLTAIFENNVGLAASFFTHLSAPLTSLHLAEGLQHPQVVCLDAVPAVQQLLGGVAAFTQLRSCSAVLPVMALSGSTVPGALSSPPPFPLTALCELRCLSLTAAPAMLRRVTRSMAAAATALTRLRLRFYEPSDRDPSVHREAVTATWPEFFRSLHQLELQNLEVDWETQRPRRHGVALLQPLTQLTALRARGWQCVDTAADWQALAGMTRLQHLVLDYPDNLKLPHGCISAMRALASLTSLTVKNSEHDEEMLPGLAEHLPQALPALQELTVALWDPFDAADALTGLTAALPALERLTVHLFPNSCADEESSDDEASRGCYGAKEFSALRKRLEDVKARLKAAAADASVALSLHAEEYRVYI